MNYEEIVKKLSLELSSKRFAHSLGVSQTAVEMAEIFGADVTKAQLAGILHDCARNLTSDQLLQMAKAFSIVVDDVDLCEPILLHAGVGAHLARTEYDIDDAEIGQAIAMHTVGGTDMKLLDKIIYLADFVEPNRNFPGVKELRLLAKKDLNQAMLAAFNHTIEYIITEQGLIHPATVKARNSLLQQLK
jgi:predicted HD superfamily hydrolase involved in NAD metabolism